MTQTTLNLSPLNTPAVAPRSAMNASYSEATGYAMGYQLERDTFNPMANDKAQHRDRYLQARAHQQERPMWQRILTGAAILTGAILGGSFLIQKINTLPIIQDALNSHNTWVRRPAKIMSFFGEMALFETLMEFGTIGLEALMAFFL